jgi:hypothetical protein
MNKIIFYIIFNFTSVIALAQNSGNVPIQNITNDQNVVYRLFSTNNIYTFIMLNTKNGRMWQVQWGLEEKYRHESILSETNLVNKEDERIGRFFLYPTSNIYTFILVDQIDGRTWQVQWGKEGERMVIRI